MLRAGYKTELENLARKLSAAPFGGKTSCVRNFAALWNRQAKTIWRDLQKTGYKPDRKIRKDAGVSQSLSEQQIIEVARLIISHIRNTRNKGKPIMTMGQAQEELVALGIIQNPVSLTTLSRLLTLNGLHPKQISRPSAHVNLKVDQPNDVWGVDASLHVAYYLEGNKFRIMEESLFNENKPQNIARIAKYKIIRYGMVDYFSGAFFVKYYLAESENWEILLDFLLCAFAQKKFTPLHGLPKILLWDKGSERASPLVRNLLEALEIRFISHRAGNPQAKGGVEGLMNLIETHFENRMSYPVLTREHKNAAPRITYKTHKVDSIQHLNHLAFQWTMFYNFFKVHKRHDMTRWQAFNTITPETLREAPPRNVCMQALQRDLVTRKIQGNLTISYGIRGQESFTYSIKEAITTYNAPINVGDDIEVRIFPLLYPRVCVVWQTRTGEKQSMIVEPLTRTKGGYLANAQTIGEGYQSAPDTFSQKAKKRVLAQLEHQQVLPPEARRMADVLQANQSIEPKAAAIIQGKQACKIDVPYSVPPLSEIQIRKLLRQGLGRVPTAQDLSALKNATEETVMAYINEKINAKS